MAELTNKAIPELSADTLTIESKLKEVPPGSTVGYADLSAAIGRDVRQHAYGNLQSAIRRLRNNDRMVFAAVRNVGIKRLDGTGIVDGVVSDIAGMRRRSKRSLKKLACVEFDALPEDKKREHLTYSSQIGAMVLFGKTSTTKKIEEAVSGSVEALPVGKTLALFGG